MPNTRKGIIADLRWFRAMHRLAGAESSIRPMQIKTQYRHFRAWRRSLCNRTPMDDAQPWMTFDAIEALVLRGNLGRVFEWGSGGSTLFFRNHAAQVITVEHDRSYFNLVSSRIKSLNPEHAYHLIPPSDSPPDRFRSSRHPGYFGDYVNAIRNYQDQSFDLVSVDGRSRVHCLEAAIAKVKPGGCIVLDNSERIEYQQVENLLDSSWTTYRHAGCGPYNRYFWETTLFRKHSN